MSRHVGQTVVYVGTDNLERKASTQAVLASGDTPSLDLQVDGIAAIQAGVVNQINRVGGGAVWRAAVTPIP